MAKNFGKGFGGGGMPNMQNLMKQAQKMQEEAMRAKEEITNTELEGESGNGACVVTINGDKEMLSVKLDPSIVDPDDVELLEDLILAAYNSAKEEADALHEELMPQVPGGLF